MASSADPTLYVAALCAAYLLPGPDMAMVIASTASGGVRRGMLASAGLAASRAVHVILSGLGLSAVFAAHPVLFDMVRWIGAAYLLWLAWKVVRAELMPECDPPPGGDAARSTIRQGFLTNLLNPKAFMFCALLLPQFIAVEQGNLAGQYLLLGAILLVVGFLFDTVYVLAADGVGQRLSTDPISRKIQKSVFASVFVVLAVRLAVGESRA